MSPKSKKSEKKKDKVTVAALQCELSDNLHPNLEKICDYIKKAAKKGAQIILPSELFQGHYFCKEERDENFARALTTENNPLIEEIQKLAKKLSVVVPVSFFEKDGPHYYNSVAIIDADGTMLGIYRKSHIPDGPGYEEKFYFKPGNTGFRTWQTAYATIGVGICWDQWFPECARAMVLKGADLLFYPTAIGSEPQDPTVDTKDPWQRAMIGHSVSNVVPVIAANRTGKEGDQKFYGHSFITDHRGEKISELGRKEEGIAHASIDLNRVRTDRASFGFFRDRRPDLYTSISER